MREDGDTNDLGLPGKPIPGPYLLDPEGGVIDVLVVKEALLRGMSTNLEQAAVAMLEDRGRHGVRLWTTAGTRDFDACVIAAGAATSALASQVELYTPTAMFHHLRVSFALRDANSRPPCIIERHEPWRPGVATYQHLAAPGLWAVGAHVDPALCRWERGRSTVMSHERELLRDYARQVLDGVADDTILDEIPCSMTSGWGDGFGVTRSENVIAVYGDNRVCCTDR